MAKINDLEVEDYLAECISVFPETLQEEYVRVPSDIAYWSAQYSAALRALLRAELDAARTKAQLRIEWREKLLAENGKVTESMVDSAVEIDDRWQKVRLTEIEAEVDKVRLHGVVEAVRAKKDMIVGLGATHRAEMERDPIIREMSRGRKLVAE